MKVKDLIKMDIDVDVYDNVCDDIGIAFCGALELTDEGKAKFEIALNLDVESLDEDDAVCVINVDDEFFPDNWKFNLKRAKEFFYAAAGYCSESDWNKWFKESEV